MTVASAFRDERFGITVMRRDEVLHLFLQGTRKGNTLPFSRCLVGFTNRVSTALN